MLAHRVGNPGVGVLFNGLIWTNGTEFKRIFNTYTYGSDATKVGNGFLVISDRAVTGSVISFWRPGDENLNRQLAFGSAKLSSNSKYIYAVNIDGNDDSIRIYRHHISPIKKEYHDVSEFLDLGEFYYWYKSGSLPDPFEEELESVRGICASDHSVCISHRSSRLFESYDDDDENFGNTTHGPFSLAAVSVSLDDGGSWQKTLTIDFPARSNVYRYSGSVGTDIVYRNNKVYAFVHFGWGTTSFVRMEGQYKVIENDSESKIDVYVSHDHGLSWELYDSMDGADHAGIGYSGTPVVYGINHDNSYYIGGNRIEVPVDGVIDSMSWSPMTGYVLKIAYYSGRYYWRICTTHDFQTYKTDIITDFEDTSVEALNFFDVAW